MQNKKIFFFLISLVAINILALCSFAGFQMYHLFNKEQVKGISTYQAPVTDPVDQITQLISRGDLLSSSIIKNYSLTDIQQITQSNFPSFSQLSPRYDVSDYTFRYYSNDENGKPITVDANILVPTISDGKEAPLLVFAPSASGLANSCSPLESIEHPTDILTDQLLPYATQGYIVVIPDIEKIATPADIYPFYNAQLESHEMLDAVQAGYTFFTKVKVPTKPQRAVFLAGFSEGGNDAFASKDHLYEYAPFLPIKGIIGIAPMTNVLATLKDNPYLAPYLLYSYEKNIGDNTFHLNQLLQNKWLSSIESDITHTCVSEMAQYYSTDPEKIYTNSFYNAIVHDTVYQQFPELNSLFEENSSGLRPSKLPTLVVQGTADTRVTVADQTAFLKNACDIQNNISLISYDGVNHQQIVQDSFKDIVNWMGNVLNGDVPQSICSKLQAYSSQ